MKKLIWFIASLVLFSLGGCASGPSEQAKPQANVQACVFPDDGTTLAPDWVCGAPYKNLKIFAVGSYERTKAGYEFQRTMAAAVARDKLAREARVRVEGMVKRYAETTGAGDTETVDRVDAAISKQITKEDLRGTRVYTIRTNPNTKTLYVLVGMDDKLAQEFARHQLETSMRNDRAIWQKLQAKKSFDELAKEIANYK